MDAPDLTIANEQADEISVLSACSRASSAWALRLPSSVQFSGSGTQYVPRRLEDPIRPGIKPAAPARRQRAAPQVQPALAPSLPCSHARSGFSGTGAGCVPLVNAVCCPNGYAACPEGTTCVPIINGTSYNTVYNCTSSADPAGSLGYSVCKARVVHYIPHFHAYSMASPVLLSRCPTR